MPSNLKPSSICIKMERLTVGELDQMFEKEES